jgi:hypothetical protein
MLHSVIKEKSVEMELLVGWYTPKQMMDELHLDKILEFCLLFVCLQACQISDCRRPLEGL